VEAQLKWLNALQSIADRLRTLRDRRKTRRCLHDIAVLEKERNRISQQLDPFLLRRFEILLERRQGKAIAPIRGKSCGACGLVLPEQTVIDVQTMEFLISCESCNRFLYWDHEEERKRQAQIAAEAASVTPKQVKKVKTFEPVAIRKVEVAKRVGVQVPAVKKRPPETPKSSEVSAAYQKIAAKTGAPEKTVPPKESVGKRKPAAKKPVVKKPTAKKPVPKKPAVKKSAAKKPVTKKPVVKKSAAKKPILKKPVVKKSAIKKPVPKKPVAKKSGTKKTAVKKSPHRKRAPGISRTPKRSPTRK